MLTRDIEKNLKDDFFSGKIIILTGARQVGKTTLLEKILANYDQKAILRLNGENPADVDQLNDKSLEFLEKLIQDYKIIFIDEAQKIFTIGQTAKLIIDRFKNEKQLILTGSSSFNLLTKTTEPLTGRKFIYQLFPFSVSEIIRHKNKLQFEKELENLLIYGSYPEVYLAGNDKKERLLTALASSYLYKDILEFQRIKNPALLTKLLMALALQIGSETSLTELANLLDIDKNTVERYIDLLEKNYIIYRLPPFYTNKRKSIAKMNKVYFCDLGVRNALINNFNPLDKRVDIGGLWENFIINERLKYRKYNLINVNPYFWRSYDGAEMDLIEERGGKLMGYEIKWGKRRTNPKSWLEYPNAEYTTINRENYLDFLV